MITKFVANFETQVIVPNSFQENKQNKTRDSIPLTAKERAILDAAHARYMARPKELRRGNTEEELKEIFANSRSRVDGTKSR